MGILAALGCAATVISLLWGGIWTGLLVLAAMGLVFAVTLRFTGARYREIARLSDCLTRIAGGDYSVDLREYGEGELSILYDELHKVTRTLSHQAEQLQRDKEWLADTMADISHQLKTPLTSVTMFTELLADGNLPEERRREFLAGIESGAERIRWLVLSLLKLSRLDADAVVFRREDIPAALLLERAAEPLLVAMEHRGQTLELKLEDSTISGDLSWLSEAVGNLLKNAMEHSPQGGRITVHGVDNPLYTLLEISDNGAGIPQEELPHIFERFYRGKNATSDSAGIGLALSKSIINRHGGAVEVQSAPGEGTRFTLKFYKMTI